MEFSSIKWLILKVIFRTRRQRVLDRKLNKLSRQITAIDDAALFTVRLSLKTFRSAKLI